MLIVLLLVFSAKCYGALQLLRPEFDLLRYLPPASLLKGFAAAVQQQESWGGAAPLPLHVLLPAEVSVHLKDAAIRDRVNALVEDIMKMPEATVREELAAATISAAAK